MTASLDHTDGLYLAPGRTLPDGLRTRIPEELQGVLDGLLRAANGQTADAIDLGLDWLPSAERLLNADEMEGWLDQAAAWHADEDPEDIWHQDRERVASWIWHPARIPVAGNPDMPTEGGLFVDGVPGPEGVLGQVIARVSEAEYLVLAPSLDAFFDAYVSAVDSGALQVAKGAYGWRVEAPDGTELIEVFRRA